MNSYIKKLIIFFSPLFVLFLFVVVLLWQTNEFLDVSDIKKLHTSGVNYLVGRTYIPFEKDFKYAILNLEKPDVTTLGNSRVLQFRKEFFKEDLTFYNYSQMSNINTMSQFLDSLNVDYAPKVIIVGLEQSYFLEKGSSLGKQFATDGIGKVDSLRAITRVIRDLLQQKIPLSTIRLHESAISFVGIRANVLRSGFRNDGSMNYGGIVPDYRHPDHEDHLFHDSFERIEKGCSLFEYGQQPLERSLDDLNLFLQKAHDMDIHIVGFLPPYAPTVYKKMEEYPTEYSYMNYLDQDILEIFEQYEHSFFDFTDPKEYGFNDLQFIDGYHGSEVIYGIITRHIATEDSVFADYVDSASITNVLELKLEDDDKYLFP